MQVYLPVSADVIISSLYTGGWGNLKFGANLGAGTLKTFSRHFGEFHSIHGLILIVKSI